MTIDKHIRPHQSYHANLHMFGSTALALLAWSTLPEINVPTAADIAIPVGMGVASGFGIALGFRSYWKNFLLRKSWEQARTPYQEKDDFLLTEEKRIKIGMREPIGRLLGTTLDGKPIFLPHLIKPAFEYILGGQGTGKTTTQVIVSTILTALTSGKSVYLNDIKKEILPQVIEALKFFGIEVVCTNVGAGAQDICPGVDVPSFELAIDAYFSSDKGFHQLTNTFIRAYSEIAAELKEGNEKAAFFIENAQLLFQAIFVYLLVFEPDNMTATRIWKIASSHSMTVKCLNRLTNYTAQSGDTVVEDAQGLASTLLDMDERKPDYLPQFRNKLVLGLRCFDTSGPLNNFGRGAVARISDMRKRPMVFASMTPLANIKDMQAHTSFLAFNFFMSAKAFPNGIKMHGIIDEFTTLNLPGFADEMLSLRGLGVSAEMYIQSRIALEKRLGELAARMIFEQSDMWQMSGLSYEDAKYASEILGTRNVRQYSGNVKGAGFEDVGFGFHDREEPIFSPQELMALPREEQIIKIRGFRPDHLKKLPYWDVDGLKQLCDINPLEGPPPETKPKLGLKITKDGVKVLWWRKPDGFKRVKDNNPKKERLIRPSSFLWLYAWAAIILIGGFELSKPVLHFYIAQTARGCEYLSLRGQRTIKSNGNCQPIWIRQKGGQS